MARYLSDNCYCNGSLTANSITTTELKANKAIIPTVEIEHVDVDTVQSDYVYGTEEVGSGHIDALHTLTLANESIDHWQDVVDRGYVTTVPMHITEGTGVLGNDIQDSTGKIVYSDPNIYSTTAMPYRYIAQTNWNKAAKEIYQVGPVQSQRSTTDRSVMVYDTTHNYYNTSQFIANGTVFNNDVKQDIVTPRGKHYSWIHTDIDTTQELDNSNNDIVGFATLRKPAYTTTYTVVVRSHSIDCDGVPLTSSDAITYVSCFGYRKATGNINQLIVVGISSQADEYYVITVVEGNAIIYNRTLTIADIPTDHQWTKEQYPNVFHVSNNDNTLMIVIRCKVPYSSTTIESINHYTLDMTADPSPLTPYTSFDYTTTTASISLRMKFKQYVTRDNQILLADGWNWNYNNNNNAMTNITSLYGAVELINPYDSTTGGPTRHYIHDTQQLSTHLNYFFVGLIDLSYDSSHYTDNYAVIFDMNYSKYYFAKYTVSADDDKLTLSTAMLPVNCNSDDIGVSKTKVGSTEVTLAYCNWNCRSPYLVYCNKGIGTKPTSSVSSRKYYIVYMQLCNLNHVNNDYPNVYTIPPYLTDNCLYCNDGKVYP